jgi:hypothetical protein
MWKTLNLTFSPILFVHVITILATQELISYYTLLFVLSHHFFHFFVDIVVSVHHLQCEKLRSQSVVITVVNVYLRL